MITDAGEHLSTTNSNDLGLDVLLQLNGEIFPMENGYWTKIEAKIVDANEHIPHGIKYSLRACPFITFEFGRRSSLEGSFLSKVICERTLSLHAPNNMRLLGYDNAHGIKLKRKKYGAKKLTWDHRHEQENVEPYEFDDAVQLVEDFWTDVERILAEAKR